MPRNSTIDKFKELLFADIDSVVMTSNEADQLKRYRAIFAQRLENPSISNVELTNFIISECGISKSQAYRDIAVTEKLFGSIVNADKEWTRYLVFETLKEAIQIAKDDGDAETMVKACSAMGKFARLDQEDPDKLPYDDIVPQQIDFVNDPSILGVENIDNPRQYVDKMVAKYIDNVEFEEVK